MEMYFYIVWVGVIHPLKINMEAKNHPTEKENHLNQTFIPRDPITLPENGNNGT